MKTNLIAKSSAVGLSALMLLLGAKNASAITLKFEQDFPATSGRPYTVWGTNGQDFSNWNLTNDRVTNNAAATRAWTVPIAGTRVADGGFITNVRLNASCTSGSFASAMVYDNGGNLIYSNFLVPCLGISTATPITGASPHVTFSAGTIHNIIVEYALVAAGSAGTTVAASLVP